MATSIKIYDQARLDIFDSTIDLDADTIKVALLNNSATFTAANTVFSDVSTNELSGGNGYTSGGATLGSKTVTKSGSTVTFDAADVTWTASGGDIGPAYKAVFYDTTLSNRLIAFLDLDGAKTANNGTPLNLVWNASGIFTLTGGG
jgi:hypothetical protein